MKLKQYVSVLFCLPACTIALSATASGLPNYEIEFPETNRASVELGQLLFYDPILSGNRDISCATCHHPKLGTSDGLALGIGDGGSGLGLKRKIDADNPPEQRIPRNSPALFNLGATEFKTLFHDGRLERDHSKPGGIRTPLGREMVSGFDSILSAQTMFPVIAPDEMAGHYSENEISKAVRMGRLTHAGGAWDLLTQRVAAIPEYRERFDEVLGVGQPIQFTDIANQIAEFMVFEWRAVDSPFDDYLRGQGELTAAQKAGLDLFYGEAACSSCHSGLLQTDHGFHAIAMPQFGPGKAERFETHQRDTGRERVTGNADDLYRFRTPSLRNVALTAPYGHSGAYATLTDVIRHHLNPLQSYKAFRQNKPQLPEFPGANDWAILEDEQESTAIAAANELPRRDLSEAEVDALVAFLHSLTDPVSVDGRLGVPESVPSGLAVQQ